MFAEHGAAVSLRDIAREAGQRNNSAVTYHFGGREGLIEAIIERRLLAVEEYGRDALALADRSSPRDLIAVLVRSLEQAPTQQGATHYARFLEVMRAYVKPWPTAPHFSWAIATFELVNLAPGADEAARRRRVSAMTTAMFALLADRERAPETGPSTEEIIDMLAALHSAGAENADPQN